MDDRLNLLDRVIARGDLGVIVDISDAHGLCYGVVFPNTHGAAGRKRSLRLHWFEPGEVSKMEPAHRVAKKKVGMPKTITVKNVKDCFSLNARDVTIDTSTDWFKRVLEYARMRQDLVACKVIRQEVNVGLVTALDIYKNRVLPLVA